MIPLYLVMAKLHLRDTYSALILPFAVDAFSIFLVRQYVLSLPLRAGGGGPHRRRLGLGDLPRGGAAADEAGAGGGGHPVVPRQLELVPVPPHLRELRPAPHAAGGPGAARRRPSTASTGGSSWRDRRWPRFRCSRCSWHSSGRFSRVSSRGPRNEDEPMKQRPLVESTAPTIGAGTPARAADGVPARGVTSDALARVRDYLARRDHLIVGLMSGTSADGVDAALVRVSGAGPRPQARDRRLQRDAVRASAAARDPRGGGRADAARPSALMRLDAALGERYAAAVVSSCSPGAGVGSARAWTRSARHGQTVRHVPRDGAGGEALTLQIGSAACSRSAPGSRWSPTSAARDTAAGGEGRAARPDRGLVAVPLARRESRVLLNLGGMANVTYLPRTAA